MIVGQVMQTLHVGGWPTGNGEKKWGGYGRIAVFDCAQSLADGLMLVPIELVSCISA